MTNDKANDDEVIAAVLAGRRQDFALLVNRYNGKLIKFINGMIADRDEAQSLAQDVFVKIFQNLPYYKMQNNFSAFIFKVAKNTTLNWISRQKRTVFFSRLLGHEVDKFPSQQAAAAAADPEQAERDEAINRNLRRLPEEQRLALILKVYLEFSYKQIHDISGWSIPKIETLISRAKSRLKKNIALQEKNPGNVYQARKK